MFDVAIIGGGPAGCGAAIALRQTFPSLRVLVVEASDYSRRRAGEVLPPMARPLLEHLGVLGHMSAEVCGVARGVAHAWGGPKLEERDYFFRATGEGWHLERNRFDVMLANHADTCGAEVWRKRVLHGAERTGDIWQMQMSDCQVESRWVIDATGRNATFARIQGARFNSLDSLTAFSRVFQHEDEIEARTIVEACAHGWWYATPLPGRRRVVSMLTDADLGRSLRLADTSAWLRALKSATHMQTLVANAILQPSPLVRSAATVALDRVYGEGWLATGDASSAFDPLSGQGITNALRSGILAAFAVGDTLCHNSAAALVRYEAIQQKQRASFARTHREHYSREQRWSQEPFWSRRQDPTAAPLGTQALDDIVALEGTH
jgi:flavin-dependent dehydrogenase